MEDKYTIADREFQLKVLKGRKARRSVPRIIEIAAAAFKFASDEGVDVGRLFDEENPDYRALANILYQLAVYFGDEYDKIEQEVFPVLLCAEDADWVFIDENATPGEIYRSLWTAIQYHLETSFGVEVQQALKNLQEAPPEEAREV